MSDAPKIVPDRLRAAATREAHPEADMLTAFVEQALSGVEREDVIRHLARCGDCREVVALSLPPSVETAVKPEVDETAVSKPANQSARWFAWPTLRWAALAASVVVVASVLFLHPGKQTDSNVPTEKLAAQGNVHGPAIDATTKAVAPSESEPPQSPAARTSALADQTLTREVRSGRRDKKRVGRAQTSAAAPPVSLANNKRLDSLQDKDAYSFGAGRLTTPQPATSGIVARGEASATDQAGAPSNGIASVGAFANEPQSAPVQGGLLAKNDAPALPIEKAKPAAKEEAEGKSQLQQSAPQDKLAGRAAESEVFARREKTSLKQPKKVYAPQWGLVQGKLQRSLDTGKTWQTALQLDDPVLAFGVLGSDVWAGGQSGALLHSADGGATWVTIQPTTNAATLSSNIVAIEIRSATEITLSTSTGEFWTTSDAGKTWDRK